MGFFKNLFGGGEVRVDYSDRTDDELRALWGEREALTGQARELLQAELERRQISTVPYSHDDALGLMDEAEQLPDTEEIRKGWGLLRQSMACNAHRDLQGALEAGARAEQLFATALGKSSAPGAATLRQLALAHEGAEQREEAEALWGRAIEMLESSEKLPGEHAPELVGWMRELTATQRARARLAEAEAVLRRAAQLAETMIEPGEPLLAFVLEDLTETLKAAGREQEAAELERQIEQIYGELDRQPA
jgi:tetratricopeptide (TPR) repeat protein